MDGNPREDGDPPGGFRVPGALPGGAAGCYFTSTKSPAADTAGVVDVPAKL